MCIRDRFARECLDAGARAVRPGITTDEIDSIVHKVLLSIFQDFIVMIIGHKNVFIVKTLYLKFLSWISSSLVSDKLQRNANYIIVLIVLSTNL